MCGVFCFFFFYLGSFFFFFFFFSSRRRHTRFKCDWSSDVWSSDLTDYVKRVIGLPGDRIQMIDGLLHINGAPVKRERIADFIDDENGGAERVRRWRETLPNGVSYESLDLQDNGFLDNTEEYLVPTGHYFMMGDNRDNSADSRVPSAVGYVPFENLIGKAQIIFFSIGDGEPAWHIWSWPWSVRWSRLFTIVR